VRIAIVTHNVVRGDGQGRVAFEIARQAIRQGHQISLLAAQVDPELIEEGARWMRLEPAVSRIHLCKVPLFARLANRALASHSSEFDVVHGFGYSLTVPHAVNSAQFIHAAWARSPAHPGRGKWSARNLYQSACTWWNTRWERSAYAGASTVIACSSQVGGDLISIGVSERKIRIIPNGVDLNEYKPGMADRATLGLPKGVPLALFVGDLRLGRKNLDAVLRALPLSPSVHLAVAGSLEGSPYPAMAKRLRIEQRVHFLDFRSDMADLMRAADVFVFPSLYEPFGLVVLEALATGLPVITATTVGAADLVREGGGVVVSEGGDEAALARALGEVLEDGPRRAAMKRAARAAAEQHSWRRMAEAYLDVYASAVKVN
jgi:glycosyltransferase involved in cell wall biosynthesis